MLHHDTAPSHTFFFTREFFTKGNMTVVPHPPYSPDLTLCYFFLFSRLKIKLKGRHFDTIEVIEAESQAVLNPHRIRLSSCTEKWQNRWERCICAEGGHFEGGGGQ
jgi:histone-lysine N-methyltransferase SETMAR